MSTMFPFPTISASGSLLANVSKAELKRAMLVVPASTSSSAELREYSSTAREEPSRKTQLTQLNLHQQEVDLKDTVLQVRYLLFYFKHDYGIIVLNL